MKQFRVPVTRRRRRRGRAGVPAAAALVLLLCGGPTTASAQEAPASPPPIVSVVDVQGNQFLQKETLLYYVSTKAGDRFDEIRLKEDFRRLWDTGFLEDLALDVQDTPQGKYVRFIVHERRRIQIVDYRGSKALTNSKIEDELKKQEAALRLDSFYDIGKARRVEAIVHELLQKEGRPFGTVSHEVKNVGGSGVQVSFNIEDGPKAKVRAIEFTGNTVFSGGDLRGQMKKIKQKGFTNLSWVGGKTTYDEAKWVEDQESLRNFYLDNGYVTATIGQPEIKYEEEGDPKKPPSKHTRWMTLTVPVTEGEQYKVGEVKFEGLTVFKEEALRPLFKVTPGDVYNDKRIKKAYEKLRDLYGSLGYFQWTGFTKRTPDPERKVVDLVLTMEEDKRYYVGRINFTGNDVTRDKVIRREVFLNEGDVFNTEALKLSIKRINQLGYFKAMEGAPDLQPSKAGDDKLDITFKVEEQNRNQFTFGAGVSGLEGTFVNASFSTANFLGLGETLQLSWQQGQRTKNYQVALTEPYLFDRPITAGIDLFRRHLEYQTVQNLVGYTQENTGASLVGGFPLGRFSRFYANYAYEIINTEGLSLFSKPATLPEPGVPGAPVVDPFYYGQEGKTRESRIGPSAVRNTVDNPYTPRVGSRASVSMLIAGGPLGGELNYWKPDLELIKYFPHTRKTALGLRGQFSYIKPYSDTHVIPFYQRFFMGGENQIRGYEVRTVGPVEGGRALGGNKFILFNAEYYFDIFGPLRFLLFYDAGQAYLEGHSIKLNELRTSTGAEIRFNMPVINVPFRLIYAFNPQRDLFQPKSTFKFAVGTTF